MQEGGKTKETRVFNGISRSGQAELLSCYVDRRGWFGVTVWISSSFRKVALVGRIKTWPAWSVAFLCQPIIVIIVVLVFHLRAKRVTVDDSSLEV